MNLGRGPTLAFHLHLKFVWAGAPFLLGSGSSTGGYPQRIFAGREKKPLLVGSFYGRLPDEKTRGGGDLASKQRTQEQSSSLSK